MRPFLQVRDGGTPAAIATERLWRRRRNTDDHVALRGMTSAPDVVLVVRGA